MIYLAAVNLESGLVITADDKIYPIASYYDHAGDECELQDACQAVAGCDNTWFSFDPREWMNRTATIH